MKRLVSFILFFRSFLPNLAQNLLPWYQVFDDEHLKNFDNIKKDLLKATETILCLAKPGQQYVILCGSSFYSSGFVLMLGDYLEPESGKKNKHLYSTDHNYLMQVN